MTAIIYKALDPAKVGLLVVHCSATKPSMDWGRAEIDKSHRQRGFFEIGYHFVIRRDGRVEIGRALNRQGAHVSGYNHVSVGVCMVGGVSERDVRIAENNFTPVQFESLKVVLRDLRHKFPHARIVGHGELPRVAKACPSFSVQEWLKTNPI